MKWADFCISAVRFNAAHTHIDYLRTHPDNGDALGVAQTYARSQVVAAIQTGTTFATVFRAEDGNWKFGAKVFIIHVHGIPYLKTVADGTPRDNLDRLPEF
jgi:hypothetical protein